MDLFFKNSKSNGIHYLNDFSLFFRSNGGIIFVVINDDISRFTRLWWLKIGRIQERKTTHTWDSSTLPSKSEPLSYPTATPRAWPRTVAIQSSPGSAAP